VFGDEDGVGGDAELIGHVLCGPTLPREKLERLDGLRVEFAADFFETLADDGLPPFFLPLPFQRGVVIGNAVEHARPTHLVDRLPFAPAELFAGVANLLAGDSEEPESQAPLFAFVLALLIRGTESDERLLGDILGVGLAHALPDSEANDHGMIAAYEVVPDGSVLRIAQAVEQVRIGDGLKDSSAFVLGHSFARFEQDRGAVASPRASV
jgi:hypothetical protein